MWQQSRISRTPALKQIELEMSRADSYATWFETCHLTIMQTGADLGARRINRDLYDDASIGLRLSKLRRLRKKGDDHGLLFALNEGIHGNMAGMGQAKTISAGEVRYQELIGDIREICDALDYLSPRDFAGIPGPDRVEFFNAPVIVMVARH